MEEKRIVCSLITPLFSYGAYQGTPELRTPELKGAMRYLYRIACPVRTNILAKDEAELFGGPSNSEQKAGHASPVLLSMRGHMKTEMKNLLYHKKSKQPPQECFAESTFEIVLRYHQSLLGDVPSLSRKVDMEWYSDVTKLSLILCGMGRRSRKGKGCFRIEGEVFENSRKLLEWICSVLNKTAAASSQITARAFQISIGANRSEKEIISNSEFNKFCWKRPFIQKIRIGVKMGEKQVNGFLWAIDEACHNLKGKKIKGIPIDITRASSGGKFASPLLIRIVQTKEGYYPLYIFVNGIYKRRNHADHRSTKIQFIKVDSDCTQRERFIQIIEDTYLGTCKGGRKQ